MGTLIWDFDGTLAVREGGWSGACVDAFGRITGREAAIEEIRPHLGAGFPWHAPDEPHDHPDADAWWDDLFPVLAAGYSALGVSESDVEALLPAVRRIYLEEGWRLFDDVEPTMASLAAAGWEHVVLSNHVPELEDIVADLGIDDRFRAIYTSAQLGFEKPHPGAFRAVLDAIDDEAVWMVGDSYRIDIAGAEAVGVPGILVRGDHPAARRSCPTIEGVSRFL